MPENNNTDTLILDTLTQIEELQNKIKKNEDFESNKSQILHLWKKASTEKYTDNNILFIKEEYTSSKECTDYLVAHYLLLQCKYDIVDTLISEIENTNEIGAEGSEGSVIVNNNNFIYDTNNDIIENTNYPATNHINSPYISTTTSSINTPTINIIKLLRDNHLELIEMVNEIKNGKFEKIENFIKENKNLLRSKDLLFYYNSLQFITFVRNKSYKNGIIFARENLKEYFSSKQFNKRVKRLICILSGTDYTVYWKYYLDKIVEQVCVDFCYIKNYPGTNILDILFRNGKNVFPELVQASLNYFKQSVVTVDEKEIPVQISVTEDGKFHSQFVCPVLKVLCENDNPPSLLECGHVISAKAVSKLSKNNTFISFKCPYCPQESRTENIVTIRL